MDQGKIAKFVEIFQLPPAMVPHIDFVATDREIDLVVGLDGREMTVPEIAQMMDMPLGDAEVFVTKAFHRDIIAKATSRYGYHDEKQDEGPRRYKAGTFYRRLDPMAMYENWGDVPLEAREAVIEWQLQEYINMWQFALDEIQADPDARVRIPNRDYLLLEEALEMVEAAEDHVIVPCDCKEIVQACDRPREVCVRLNKGATLTLEHGHGRKVTKEEMKQIVVNANRSGLMATGNRNWKEDGQVFGFCQCCACDCYPIRAGVRLEMGDAYPRVYYVAERDMDNCHLCGICARRCHFDAFHYEDTKIQHRGRRRKNVAFDPDLCRGCGICVTACPEDAITMVLRRGEEEVEAT